MSDRTIADINCIVVQLAVSDGALLGVYGPFTLEEAREEVLNSPRTPGLCEYRVMRPGAHKIFEEVRDSAPSATQPPSGSPA